MRNIRHKWKEIMKMFLKMFLNRYGNMNVGLDISWMKLKQNLKTRIPEFYIEVLEAWGEFKINVCIKPERREDILKSTIVLK